MIGGPGSLERRIILPPDPDSSLLRPYRRWKIMLILYRHGGVGRMRIAGIGRVLFWEGGSIWLALTLAGNELHLHHAVQISLPLGGGVRFRRSISDPWTNYAGAVIPPDVPHAFEAPGTLVANILFEPEGPAGRALLARYGSKDISDIDAQLVARLVAPIAAAYAADAADAELVSLARAAVADLSRTTLSVVEIDPRVRRAIAHIRNNIAQPLSLTSIAAAAGLSPSRLRHLFVTETGVSCKAYVLWERLNVALSLGFSGMSWTEAAHAANFSDSAHLTRTCRRMFGMAPTGGRIQKAAHPLPVTD